MDQHTLLSTEPAIGIGHNRSPEPIGEIEQKLAQRYDDLVERFRDLELGCSRVPECIERAEEAGLVADFVAQCQSHIRSAEAAHKEEKAFFLQGGRAVDGFFKRRCERLDAAVGGVISRLKTYYDRTHDALAAAHAEMVREAMAETQRAAAEEAEHRAAARRLAATAQTAEDRRRAAEHLAQAEAASERARIAAERATMPLEPLRIEGDYGAVAYLTRTWAFEVTDLAQVPRTYLALDAEKVRGAISKQEVREIPGLRIFQNESLRVRGGV